MHNVASLIDYLLLVLDEDGMSRDAFTAMQHFIAINCNPAERRRIRVAIGECYFSDDNRVYLNYQCAERVERNRKG